MPNCVLHVTGENFAPDKILPRLSLKPYSVFHKGDNRFGTNSTIKKFHDRGGFKCDISEAVGNLEGQVCDAIAFLIAHREDFSRLRADESVESIYLDFGYDCRLNRDNCLVQCDRLPTELLKHCAEFGIEIELSLYPPVEDPR